MENKDNLDKLPTCVAVAICVCSVFWTSCNRVPRRDVRGPASANPQRVTPDTPPATEIGRRYDNDSGVRDVPGSHFSLMHYLQRGPYGPNGPPETDPASRVAALPAPIWAVVWLQPDGTWLTETVPGKNGYLRALGNANRNVVVPPDHRAIYTVTHDDRLQEIPLSPDDVSHVLQLLDWRGEGQPPRLYRDPTWTERVVPHLQLIGSPAPGRG